MIVLQHISKYLFLCSTIVFIISCAPTMKIEPQFVKMENISSLVNGKIDYGGNKKYMPRTISDNSSNNYSLRIKYEYGVNYSDYNKYSPTGSDIHNPLGSILGIPIGQEIVFTSGRLDIIRQSEVIKTYFAICTIDMSRYLFYEGPTLSELRRTGLLNIRDNIEAQMYNDREFLSKINRNDDLENKTIGGVK